MPAKPIHRKRWELALRNADMTVADVCEEFGVSRTTLNEVLAARRTSGPLRKKIVAFIERHLPAGAR